MPVLDSRDLIVMTEEDAEKLVQAIDLGGWTKERIRRFQELGILGVVEELRGVLRRRRVGNNADS